MDFSFPRRFESVLFDLDGTLADTAPDLVRALNQLLSNHNKPALAANIVRGHVSQGSVALTRLGFPEAVNTDRFENLRLELLDLYSQSLYIDTRLFDGMATILDTLTQVEIPWGVVTNKPGWLTEPLLAELLKNHSPKCIVSGDTLSQRKPHPAPLLHACEQLQCNVHESIYIGDDPRDVYAGNAAGMYTCIAAYGYIHSPREQLQEWGADIIINDPQDLTRYIALNVE